MKVQAEYTPLFEKNLKQYHSLRWRVRSKVDRVLQDPYDRSPRSRVCSPRGVG